MPVLHLRCHIGTDTVCLARHGARAVGLDIAGASVEAARALAAECGVGIEYVRSDVHGAVDALGGRRFDVVHTGTCRPDRCIGPMLDAVREAGRELTGFTEHDVSPWRRRPDMRDLGGGWWGRPDGTPLLFSLRASRPA